MKITKIFTIVLMTIMVLSGCSASTPEEDPTGDAPFIRSASTIRNDSVTKRVITTQESYQLGTHITISVYDEETVPDQVFDEIFYAIYDYEKIISKNMEETVVNEINDQAGLEAVPVPDTLFELIENALDYSELSNGAFDASIGPLVDLWGIGTPQAAVPDQESIDEAMRLVDFTKIQMDVDKKSVFLKESGMVMDLGAIAKGYIADEVKSMLLDHGYESAIINLGGNVLMVGNKPNSESWSVGVRDPLSESGSYLGILGLNDNSIVSSGVYERFFEEDAVRYHHLINPKTGFPEQNELMAVSIISEKSMQGDALSTAVFVLGLDKGYELVSSLAGVEAIFIIRDKRIIMTPELKDSFKLIDSDYMLAN